jgi:hypothetical protein
VKARFRVGDITDNLQQIKHQKALEKTSPLPPPPPPKKKKNEGVEAKFNLSWKMKGISIT